MSGSTLSSSFGESCVLGIGSLAFVDLLFDGTNDYSIIFDHLVWVPESSIGADDFSIRADGHSKSDRASRQGRKSTASMRGSEDHQREHLKTSIPGSMFVKEDGQGGRDVQLEEVASESEIGQG
ncbi:hypothetical protein K435DRAFT_970198 [Dendrothele bispora CBS 962.96]|uniref:Uncharacterized protein n=1 Tax=Dendrothele bispora (strain CBS 962.96) TaxID=1314807 RepID=A0A4S8LCL2_DENBC|nr:hypothetical protein K435DRAFT_970198 [Dendrothele bispora CBS 962.96]